MSHTKESLVAFEQRVADAFAAKRIAAPVHLCSPSQAEPLIDVFKSVKPNDWVFSTWRSHFHALLKGIPEDELFDQILQGRSMFVMSREHRFFSSAIVGGILPIACGVAMAIKRSRERDLSRQVFPSLSAVHAFIGDMAARTGLFYETLQYAKGHELPMRFVIENNGVSTNAPTVEVWGCECAELCRHGVEEYEYTRTWPHVGLNTRVEF